MLRLRSQSTVAAYPSDKWVMLTLLTAHVTPLYAAHARGKGMNNNWIQHLHVKEKKNLLKF